MQPTPRRRDYVLLLLLLVLNVGSAYTTLLGARQVLPQPMSDVLGITVQLMLFVTLAGFAAKNAPIRRWVVIFTFAAASIYTSFFAYYDQLAGQANEGVALDRAHQAHAQFVNEVYQPANTEIARVEREAAELQALAEREASGGVTTGVRGFGPVARKYAEQAREKEAVAARLQADLERQSGRFEYDVEGMTAAAIYSADLEAWQTAPSEWKEHVPSPPRTAYVDVEQEVALLTPYWKVKRGELPALAALLLALLVDGIAILMGSAITGGGRPLVDRISRGTADAIEAAKAGEARVRGAMNRPPTAEPPLGADAALDDALRLIVLRVDGRGSEFLARVYQAIDPSTGSFDFAGLQKDSRTTWRLAARMLADRLRSPRIGWLVVEDGHWRVPEAVYAEATAWLGEHLRVEMDGEADADLPEEPQASTLRLVLP